MITLRRGADTGERSTIAGWSHLGDHETKGAGKWLTSTAAVITACLRVSLMLATSAPTARTVTAARVQKTTASKARLSLTPSVRTRNRRRHHERGRCVGRVRCLRDHPVCAGDFVTCQDVPSIPTRQPRSSHE